MPGVATKPPSRSASCAAVEVGLSRRRALRFVPTACQPSAACKSPWTRAGLTPWSSSSSTFCTWRAKASLDYRSSSARSGCGACCPVHSTTHGHCIRRWKMPPSGTELDGADRRLTDAEARADLALHAGRRPDRLDRLGRELRPPVALACRRPPASLRVHVAHVVQVRAREKMGRVDAQRPVAAVQDMGALRDGPICGHEGQAVRSAVPTSPVQLSIVIIVPSALPQPTPFGARRFVGVVIEPLLQRCASPHVGSRAAHAALGTAPICARAAR
jgi:hypothetical protein